MKFQFHKNKYGQELLIDCDQMSNIKEFTLDNTPFWIDFHEIFFITSGTGIFNLDDEKIPFKEGTVLLLPPNKWRQWASINGNLDGYILIFEEEFISNFFNDSLFLFRFHYFYNNATPSFIQLEENALATYITNLVSINKELKNLQNDSNHLLRAFLYLTLININRAYTVQFGITDDFFEDNLSLQFRKLLEQEIRDHKDVPYYAQQLGVSKSHLTKTLKKSFAKTPAQLIRERLITEAKKLLVFSKLNISEISYSLNFSEPSNFNRLFKEMVGLSPKEFRSKNSI